MSRKSVAKYELDKAENKLKKRMNSEMQNALDDLRKKTGITFDIADMFIKSKVGKIILFVENGVIKHKVDAEKGESAIKQIIGLVADAALSTTLFVLTKNPYGFFVSAALNIAELDPSTGYKKLYDYLFEDNDLPEITPNGFLKVTMPDGTVYARPFMPNAQGSLFGNGKDDVLFGGSGNDMLIGYGGADLLIGGSGKDDYFVDNGDTIKDSDGKGRVFLSSTNIQLTGGTQIEKGSKIYKGKDDTKYEIDGYNLIINDNITIENFNPYADEYLGITLYEADEISVSVSDASAKEKEQSMSFTISLSRELKENEFVKVTIPAIGNNKAKTYMFLHGSSTDWKVGDGIEYIFDSSTTYTYSWSDDKNIEPDETISVKATIIDKPENLIAKDGKVGTGTIQDDDDDPDNPNDTFPDTDPASTKTSPIVIDLNNDGVKTISRKNNKIYFDLDNNKFAQNSAWIDKNDGILINKTLITDNNITNGSQLFGNYTLLTNGNLATNGFEALKEFANLNLFVA